MSRVPEFVWRKRKLVSAVCGNVDRAERIAFERLAVDFVRGSRIGLSNGKLIPASPRKAKSIGYFLSIESVRSQLLSDGCTL